MADDIENDDQWLYGDNPDGAAGAPPVEEAPEADTVDPAEPAPALEDEAPADATSPPPEAAPAEDYPADEFQDDGPPGVDDVPLKEPQNGDPENDKEDGELKQNGEDGEEEEDLEDDSEEDDVNVVIGDIKTSASYPQQQHSIKRGGLTTTIGDKSKQIQQTGKFQVEEFEQIGTINGVPASDYNLDELEDKPWRKPGADITDYFNYGFNEDTWRAYCERQKRIRINDSGTGVPILNPIGLPRMPMIVQQNPQNFNNMMGPRPGMMPPMPPMMMKMDAPKMNAIQVMTADRREYSRKPGFPDLSQPPPMGYPVEPYIPPPEYGFNPEPEPFYGGGYEPTQDSQWMEGQGNPNWQPADIKTLTGSPPRMMGPPKRSPSRSRRSHSRDREESRSRSARPRDHEREKSRRRDRSRSRSRRHKSRSRSPGHRSHKKKKSSRRHEESD